mgnify:CR=1 FL=1
MLLLEKGERMDGSSYCKDLKVEMLGEVGRLSCRPSRSPIHPCFGGYLPFIFL